MNMDRHLSLAIFAAHGKRPWLDKVAIFCARELVGLEALALLFVLASVGANIEHRGLRLGDFGSALPIVLLLILCAWGLAVVLELAIRRPRPYKALGKKPLDRFWTPTPGMPSSHAAIAFALASAAAAVGPAWIPAAFFATAAIVATGRVYVGVHYVSDVLVGAVVGFVSFLVAGAFGFWLFGFLGV